MRKAGICLGKESTEDSPQMNSNPAKTILNKLWWRIPAPCPLLAALHTDRCLKSRKYGSFQQQQQSSVVGAFLCFTVLLGWLAQDVLLASMLFWAFLLAAVFLPLPPGDGHVQTEESQLSLHNHCSSDLSHFCPHKRILSTYFLLTSSIFSRLSLSPSSLAVMRVQAYRGAAVLFSHR